MEYLEFRKKEEKDAECIYVDSTGSKKLSIEKSCELITKLNETNYQPEIIKKDDEVILRYYNVIKLSNGKKEFKNKKVNRKNLFSRKKVFTIAVGSAFIIGTILTGIVTKDDNSSNKTENPTKDIVSVIDELPKNDFDFTIIESQNNNSTSNIPKKTPSVSLADEELPPKEIPQNENNEDITLDTNLTEEEIMNEMFFPEYSFDFKYEDRSKSDKANKTKELYYDIIDKYAKIYGLPTNLMVAVATQESGVHSSEISPGGGFGLFQIQVGSGWSWAGKQLTAYNFEKGQNETVTVCLNSSNCIDKNMLGDLEYNVKIGCMIMSYNLNMNNYDFIVTLQANNSGNKVREIKKHYGEDWVNHRDGLPGDPAYLEHVLSYIDPEDNLLVFKDKDNNVHIVEVNNLNVYSHVLS